MTDYKFNVTPEQREKAVEALEAAGFSLLCDYGETSIVVYDDKTYGLYSLPVKVLGADLQLSFDEFIERLEAGTL